MPETYIYPDANSAGSENDPARMYHELKVHQVELEMQNEELRRAQVALELSKSRYAELYHRAPAGYLTVNARGIILEANRTACHLLAEPEDSLYNRPLTTIIMPEDHYNYFLYRKRLKEAGGVIHSELRLLRRQAKPFWAALEFYLDKPDNDTELVRIFFSDIDSRKDAETALHESEKRYRILFETMSQGVIYQDTSGQIISVNPAAERILGLSYTQLRERDHSQPLWHAIHEDGSPFPVAHQPSMLALHNGREVHDVIMGIHVSSETSYRWILVNAVPLLRLGEVTPYQVYTTFQDITERKQVEAQIIASREEAERSNRAKSDFLACMSHELRTPMNAIMGFGQLLEMDPALNAEQKDYVCEIMAASKHLLNLIDEVLDLSKIEAGSTDLLTEQLELGSLVEETMKFVRSMASSRGLELRLDSFAEIHIKADRKRLKQALLNVLTNAIKYNKPHGAVWVEIINHDATVELRINDSGLGIPESRLQDLFMPFTRLGQDQGVEEGRGIGLTITKRLVELMGGWLEVKSQVGVGSSFSLVFPHCTEEAAR